MAAKLVIRKPHDLSVRVQWFPVGETLTKLSMQDECNVNNIIKKLDKSGILEHVNLMKAEYLDVSRPMDLQTAMQVVMDASEQFVGLPSSIRAAFENDPVKFLNFIEDPANEAEAVAMGLFDPEKAPEPEVVASEPEVPGVPENPE